MTPQSQHTASDWYKPCLPPHRGGVVVTVPEQRQCGVVTMGQEQGQMMGLEQGHNIDDHQRQCVMVTAEPHYSVPRNNSRVTPITTDHSNSGPAHVAAAHKQEPETDKTPTNEAGKMMDLLETVCKMILLKGNIFNISYVFSWILAVSHVPVDTTLMMFPTFTVKKVELKPSTPATL